MAENTSGVESNADGNESKPEGDFFVTMHGERGAEYTQVLGTATVAVLSPVPVEARLGIGLVPEPAYMLKVDALTSEQREALAAHLAKKFGVDPFEVNAALATLGMPIRAFDCTVVVRNPQKWVDDDIDYGALIATSGSLDTASK